MQNEQFAQSLYSRWDTFFAQKFEHIADEILIRHDIQSDYIEIKQLDIEIGTLLEDEFDEKFPIILREKMEEALLKCLHHPQQAQTIVKKISHSESISDLLFYFLLHGTLPWHTPTPYRDIQTLFMEVFKTKSEDLKQFLQTYGHYSGLQERLTYQLGDQALEAGTSLLKSAESIFICSYVRFLINRYKQIENPVIPLTEHRHLVWKIVYSYLLNDAGSHFNRKTFLEHTITRLATGHNITYDYLLQIIASELKSHSSEIQPSTSLLSLLLELKQAWEERQLQKSKLNIPEYCSALLEKLREDSEKSLSDEEIAAFKSILTNNEACLLFLQSVSDKEIEKLLQIFIPQERAFVFSYVKTFENFWDAKKLIKKAGLKIRLSLWLVIFSLLASDPAWKFNRQYFIYEVLKRIVTHYTLDMSLVLTYFSEYIQKIGLKNETAYIINGLKTNLIKIKDMNKEERRNSGEKVKKDKMHPSSLSDKVKAEEKANAGPYPTKPKEQASIYINNAGLILIAPFLSRLFDLLSFIENKEFKGKDKQIHAAFLLQYLVFGKNKDLYPEHELVLNKILVALDNEQSIPQTIELTEEECSHAEYLLKSVLQHWEKLRNTSLAGLREAFLQREGKLEFKDDSILLTVESKAYDVLLDSVPWNFRTVKFLWMRQVIQVRWR